MDEFERVLLKYQSRRFLVVDPIGGKGDVLIYKGTEKKLKELGIIFDRLEYECNQARSSRISNMSILSHLPDPLQKVAQKDFFSLSKMMMTKKVSAIANYEVVLLRGGGYLNDIWRDYDTFENIASQGLGVIIVGPQSFFFDTNAFKTQVKCVNREVYLFCRERYSYDLLNSCDFPSNIHVCISDDTALYLSREDFLAKGIQSVQESSFDLVCTRTDIESMINWDREIFNIRKQAELKNDGEVASRVLAGDLENVADFQVFVALVANARRVFTDRLHVAILSAILGKDTFLYPNSYHKNRGVYEFSLRKFPNVRFVDTVHSTHSVHF